MNFEEEARELTRRFRSTPASDGEYDPDELEARLYELSQLKRRMRRSIPEILRLRDEITETPADWICTDWKNRNANWPKNFMRRLKNATPCARTPLRASAPRWKRNWPDSAFPSAFTWSRNARLTNCGRRWKTR